MTCSTVGVDSATNATQMQTDLFTLLETVGRNCQNPYYGNPLYGDLKHSQENGVNCFLMPASSQESFSFTEGLCAICKKMNLDENAQVWWVGGDLTGLFPQDRAKSALDALEKFVSTEFYDSATSLRNDRLLLSEYAGPEKIGHGWCAIRTVGKLIEKRPEITQNLLAYGVVTSAAWFKSIGSVTHPNVKNFYVVHGDRPGNSDAWDSNALAKNAIIFEGGARSLGYIFDTIVSGGKVIALHGYRDPADPYVSSAKFLDELCSFLHDNQNATNDDVLAFWKTYIQTHPPFNPHTSDAHTKQAFIDLAWKTFCENNLITKLRDHVTVYSHDAFMAKTL